jgi:hypothetical protein
MTFRSAFSPLAAALLLALPLGCAAQPAVEPPSQRTYSPAAPIRLAYELPEVIAGQPLMLPLQFRTPVQQGSLLVEVASAVGVDVLEGAVTRVELGAEGPSPVVLRLLPGSTEPRYLVLQATLLVGGGEFSRGFRIDLPLPPPE